MARNQGTLAETRAECEQLRDQFAARYRKLYPQGGLLVDNWHRRVEFPELRRATIWMAAKWNPEIILIEARASGAR